MPSTSASQLRHLCHRAPVLARLLVVIVALFHGWASYASVVSSSHDPMAWLDHGSEHVEAHSPHHGHNHDDPGADDGGSQGANGHDAADHSHDKPNLPRSGAQAAIAVADDWSLVHRVPAYPAPHFAFDRPPKRFP